jgi:hemerythrin
MAITFDETLLTGMTDLDRQHRELFVRLDALIEAIRRGSSRQEVGHTLSFLRDYVATHFADEEALMREIAFPGVDHHVAEHAAFTRDLAALEAEHRRDGATPSLVVRVNVWLTSWLRTHIYEADHQIGEFVRNPPARS